MWKSMKNVMQRIYFMVLGKKLLKKFLMDNSSLNNSGMMMVWIVVSSAVNFGSKILNWNQEVGAFNAYGIKLGWDWSLAKFVNSLLRVQWKKLPKNVKSNQGNSSIL